VYRQESADENEYPTPDGYRTELRQPPPGASATARSRYTKSPERMEGRERYRTASTRSREYLSPHRPTQPSRTTSTSYVYTPGQGVNEGMNHPGGAARTSPKYYGEMPTTAFPVRERERDGRRPQDNSSRYVPPAEGVRFAVRPEDIRMQSRYGNANARTVYQDI